MEEITVKNWLGEEHTLTVCKAGRASGHEWGMDRYTTPAARHPKGELIRFKSVDKAVRHLNNLACQTARNAQ